MADTTMEITEMKMADMAINDSLVKDVIRIVIRTSGSDADIEEKKVMIMKAMIMEMFDVYECRVVNEEDNDESLPPIELVSVAFVHTLLTTDFGPVTGPIRAPDRPSTALQHTPVSSHQPLHKRPNKRAAKKLKKQKYEKHPKKTARRGPKNR